VAINFSGEFATPRSPEEVFDFLSDPRKFAPLLPDFQSMSMLDPTHFAVKVKVGVGNIRGSAEIKMELSETVRPLRALYKGQGTAVGSQVSVSAGFDLSSLSEGTRVVWQGEAGVFGKLASMAGGMLEPLGRKNIQKLIDGLQKALSEPVGAAVDAPAMDPAVSPAVHNGVSAPVEASASNPPTSEKASQEAPIPAGTTQPQVEAPVLSPRFPDVPETDSPAQNHPAEGDHGDRNS